MPDGAFGRYTGRLILQPLKDGRRMRVVEDFGFMDVDGFHWAVPPCTIVDGASIPQALWSLIGGPFEGKYRDASVVHDYYCDVRSADWRAVHLLFYRGMLASGVSTRRAKIMYLAVYFAGPRWGETVVENVRLGAPAVPTKMDENAYYSIRHDPLVIALSQAIEREGRSAVEWIGVPSHQIHAESEIVLRLDKLAQIVDQEDPSLRSMEAAIGGALAFIPAQDVAPRGIIAGDLHDLRCP